MSHPLQDSIAPYVQGIPFGVLAYVRGDQTPIQRSLGSFALDGADVFFSTRAEAAKVQDLLARPRASFFLEADGQQLAEWKNILFQGRAEPVEDSQELAHGVALLSARNPRFKERISQNGLAGTRIFRLRTDAVELLDYAKGFGFSEKIAVVAGENV
jgi:nitroimidazol reductase NimA-like FMN-containing flavoprotein (pyridoxamine 5'-phosphate oxidase superfamily)